MAARHEQLAKVLEELENQAQKKAVDEIAIKEAQGKKSAEEAKIVAEMNEIRCIHDLYNSPWTGPMAARHTQLAKELAACHRGHS